MELRDAQIVELFHVAFLDVFSRRLDPARYVLKGGANLRFFFGSVRYSEDIDLDVLGVPAWSLEKKVDDVVASAPLKALLQVADLAISESSKPKQTETTQRWKVAIGTPHRRVPIRTKIEFSHRNGEDRYRLDAVPASIVEPYALRAPSLQHYFGTVPHKQKVEALATRSETQARDVFDLDLLLRREPLPPGSVDPHLIDQAIERALEMSFSAFRDQVLPFLDPDIAELYDSGTWDQIQTFVVEKLEDAR